MDVKCFSIFVQNKYVVVTVKNTLRVSSIVMNQNRQPSHSMEGLP